MRLFKSKKKIDIQTKKSSLEIKPVSVLIVAGFLGAGKTTFIQSYINTYGLNKKVVLIENDFGELSLDATILKRSKSKNDGGFVVTSLTQGCICCNLTGEFVSAIKTLIEEQQPDILIIEPSGVGKLSAVLKSVLLAKKEVPILTIRAITVVDVFRCSSYFENFGEYFDDTILYADEICLSHIDELEAKKEDVDSFVNKATEIVRSIHKQKDILIKPIKDFFTNTNINSMQKNDENITLTKPATSMLNQQLKLAKSINKKNQSINEEKIFKTSTMTIVQHDIRQVIQSFERLMKCCPTVIRAKGVILTNEGRYEIQYVSKKVQYRKTNLMENKVTFIGSDIDEEKIKDCFHEDITGEVYA